MTNNNDPAQSLIDYINSIKPYHTKIIETEIEYQSTEMVSITFSESVTIEHSNIEISEILSSNSLKIFGTDGFFLESGSLITITDSSGNDGTYTVESANILGDPKYTVITVAEGFNSYPLVNDGFITYTATQIF